MFTVMTFASRTDGLDQDHTGLNLLNRWMNTLITSGLLRLFPTVCLHFISHNMLNNIKLSDKKLNRMVHELKS